MDYLSDLYKKQDKPTTDTDHHPEKQQQQNHPHHQASNSDGEGDGKSGSGGYGGYLKMAEGFMKKNWYDSNFPTACFAISSFVFCMFCKTMIYGMYLCFVGLFI